MPLPWLQILDAAIGVTNLARSRKISAISDAQEQQQQQIDAERQRAERALKLELQRQAGDREMGRLRFLAGVAMAGWLGTLFLALWSGRLTAGGTPIRVALGGGWMLLLAAIAASFVAQSRVAGALDALNALAESDDLAIRRGAMSSGLPGAFALWLILAGLALIGLAVLIA